jgi:DNA-binding response OmpR family regulator
MNPSGKAVRIESLRRRFAAVQVELALCVEELFELKRTDLKETTGAVDGHAVGARSFSPQEASPAARPIIDESTFTVLWAGKVCHLGCGLPFRLFERLARRPNQWASYERLIEDVWLGAPRSDEAIRSEIRRMRQKLKAAGLPVLAAAIKGRSRHYGLILQSDP